MTYRKRNDKSSLIDNSSLKKEYFNDRAQHYFKFLIDKSIEIYGFSREFSCRGVLK